MKKRFLYLGSILLVSLLLHSCEDSCKSCGYNIYDADNQFVRAELEADYCGADLIARQSAPDVVIAEGTPNETTTRFECK